MKIAIAWANPYSTNLGVAALAYSSLAILNDVCQENGIKARFSLIGSSGKGRQQLVINEKTIEFDNIPRNEHSRLKALLKLVILFRRQKTLSLLSQDIVFDISEGDSFTDKYGQRRFQTFLNSKMFFNLLGKPQVLLPQTIGPFDVPANEKKAFRVMGRKNNFIISRDKQSFEYTAKFLPPQQIMETIDVAFYMGYTKTSYEKDFVHVGINLSGLLWNGGYTRKNQFNMKSDYRALMEMVVEHFTSLPNVKVHFVSHVITRRKSTEDDYTVAEEFHQKYPGTVLAPSFKSPVEAKTYISGLDFFTGARMHACIGAISSGVPVFPLAYSRKFNGLFRETLKYDTLGDCVNEEDDFIFANMKDAFNRKEALREQIKNINGGIVAQRMQQLKKQLLASLLKARGKQ